MDLLIRGIGKLVTFQGVRPVAGAAMAEPHVIRDAFVLCRQGRVVDVGAASRAPAWSGPVLDAGGRLCTPGLVDPHTHTVFAGSRVAEFLARARGEPYTGGGILTTMAAVHGATETELSDLARPRLLAMLRRGVTTVEIKSGYGLTTEHELRLLRVVDALRGQVPLDLVPTFLGAHAVPPGLTQAAYVDRVVEEMLPRVAEDRAAAFCDVFCDQGFFTVEEAERVLLAARRLGLGIKLHADELADVGAARLAVRLGAVCADHLLYMEEGTMLQMADASVVGVLLPGTALTLGKPYAPARRMVEAGMSVALGTDFNPGSCPIASLPLCMSLGVLHMGLTAEEVLCAATLNAAVCVGEAARVGSLETGKQADLVLWDAADHTEIPYWIAHDLAHVVVKRGRVAWSVSAPPLTPS